MKIKQGFTLMEILLVVALIAVLAGAILAILNPWLQFAKANDAKRKHDLDVIQKVIEDWYNDHGCYPKPSEICYDAAKNICSPGNKRAVSQTCKICGSRSTPAAIQPYINQLPCDPESPNKDYLYQVETPSCSVGGTCSTSSCPADSCATWFRVYADFSAVATNGGYDKDSESQNCLGGGCGLSPNTSQIPAGLNPFGYDYGLTNGVVGLEYSEDFSCLIGTKCNGCGNPATRDTCLANPSCNKNKIYSTGSLCCQANPGGC